MKILIDFTQIPLERTGVGIYAEKLLENLPAGDGQDEFYLLLQSDDTRLRHLAAARPGLRVVTVPARLCRSQPAVLVVEQLWIPLLVLLHRIDLVHSLHYRFPLLPFGRRIVTVHDLTHFLWPQLHTGARRAVFRFFCRRALLGAEAVIFVSAATRADADRLFPNPRQLRFVVPLGVERFSPPAEEAAAAALAALGIDGPYVLYVGTLEPRKNLVRLIEAFDAVADALPGCRLVLAGKLGWHCLPILDAIEHCRSRAAILRPGYISPAQKQALLARASLLVYPSLYEGFGLPVLEGMAAGLPVITSRVSSLPEVAGDAALLIAPESVPELAAAMLAALTDAALSGRLRAAGPAQAAKFDWRQTGEGTLAAYRRTLAAGRQTG